MGRVVGRLGSSLHINSLAAAFIAICDTVSGDKVASAVVSKQKGQRCNHGVRRIGGPKPGQDDSEFSDDHRAFSQGENLMSALWEGPGPVLLAQIDEHATQKIHPVPTPGTPPPSYITSVRCIQLHNISWFSR